MLRIFVLSSGWHCAVLKTDHKVRVRYKFMYFSMNWTLFNRNTADAGGIIHGWRQMTGIECEWCIELCRNDDDDRRRRRRWRGAQQLLLCSLPLSAETRRWRWRYSCSSRPPISRPAVRRPTVLAESRPTWPNGDFRKDRIIRRHSRTCLVNSTTSSALLAKCINRLQYTFFSCLSYLSCFYVHYTNWPSLLAKNESTVCI